MTREGAPGVLVHVIDPEHHAVVSSGVTDESGQYTIECATIDLKVAPSQTSPEWETSDQRVSVRPAPDSQTEVPLLSVTPKEPIRGRVLDIDGNPAAGVLVGSSDFDELQITDEKGRFTLPRQWHSVSGVRAMRFDAREAALVAVSKSDNDVELRFHLPTWREDWWS
jgi:hypothetical protein